MRRREFLATSGFAFAQTSGTTLRAGAARANITPHLGAPIAGSFAEGRAADIHDDLWVRALVLDNGSARIAIALADVCVLPGAIVRPARQAVADRTGIPAANVMVCATHTHSAGATMSIFQTEPEREYTDFVTRRIADAVQMAVTRLQPARIGYGFGEARGLAFNRRYHMKPGTKWPNPFGGLDQVKTNPGVGNPDVVRVAGPVDPVVGMLSVQSANGSPIALLGNFSLHYVGGVGSGHISADYFGYWAREMGEGEHVAMLTNGAQGNVNNIDVVNGSKERKPPYVQMELVARKLAEECKRILRDVRHVSAVPLAASEEWLEIPVRKPSQADVATARKLLDAAPPGPYREMPLVYARETLLLAERYPDVERVPVQALRIGDLAIAGLPGEPFVELGLELRNRGPAKHLMVAGLANDHVGYVPTADAFEQGGYETWRAKTSYLAPDAAPRIVSAMLRRIGHIMESKQP